MEDGGSRTNVRKARGKKGMSAENGGILMMVVGRRRFEDRRFDDGGGSTVFSLFSRAFSFYVSFKSLFLI